MNRARNLHPSPYRPDDLACARRVVTNPQILSLQDKVQRADILALAFSILSKDRQLRLGIDPTASRGPARVLHVPLAVFQAGPQLLRPRRKASLTIVPKNPATPEDAA